MKRIALLSLSILVVIGVTACGAPPPAAAQAPAESTEPAEPSATWVDVTLEDNTIQSSVTSFQVGVPYTFVIANAGRHAHNFVINTPVSIAGSLENALATSLLAVDQDQLGAGDIVTVEYTFPASAAEAELEFSCLIRRHYDDGLFLPITVTE